MKQKLDMRYCQTVEKVNRSKLFYLTIAGILIAYVLLTLVSLLPYRLFFEIVIYLALAFLVYYIIRYGVADYLYIVTLDNRLVIARKVGSFQKVFVEAALTDIKLKPYKEGQKGQNLCGYKQEKKYLGAAGKEMFIFQPDETLRDLLTNPPEQTGEETQN